MSLANLGVSHKQVGKAQVMLSRGCTQGGTFMRSATRAIHLFILTSVIMLAFSATSFAYTQDDIGGDDVHIWQDQDLYEMSMDIASNGDIYVASTYLQAAGFAGIAVHRSQDGGTTWDLWGSLTTAPTGGDFYQDPYLQVVEGNVNKCFLAYTHASNLFQSRIMMVSSDLSDVAADFSVSTTVMSDPSDGYMRPRFDTDVVSYSKFYIYLVAQKGDSGGKDIAFARSIDQGTSFETSYLIGNLAPTDRDYTRPDVSYGFGGYVNVVWEFNSRDGSFDSALRFRRADSSASGGLAAWTSIYGLGSISDEINYLRPKIEASAVDAQVVIAFDRRQIVAKASILLDPGVHVSTNSGATYPIFTSITDGVEFVGDVVERAGSGHWLICGEYFSTFGIHRSTAADLTSWSALETFADRNYETIWDFPPAMALNPAEGFRVGLVWGNNTPLGPDDLYFDGEWRRDPGFPNMEADFPIDLTGTPISDPAVVDVNGDGDLEIVFSDSNGLIQVIQDDGTPLPGWPANTGDELSACPVAVGDLLNNGNMYLVTGGTTGLVHCYDAQGRVAAGNWPYVSALPHDAFVAIGAFGQGPYARGIVAAIGTKCYFLDHRGDRYPGTPTHTLARIATQAPAIGDVDGDGRPEVVLAYQEVLAAAHIFEPGALFGLYLSTRLSGSPTLGDFDLDGDVEIVAPLNNGRLHVFDDDGTDLPGFPFNSSTGSALSSCAVGNLVGNWTPEIVTAARDWTVHMVLADGAEMSGWPVDTGGWSNYGGPVIGEIESISSDVVLGSRGSQAWSWSNFGDVNPGWPKALDDNIYRTPALGDIDDDGNLEIILLSQTQLIVLDVGRGTDYPQWSWPMAGYDPQRTGCYLCTEDLVTPVSDDLDAVTRVSFAAPSPNPSSGSATFRFAVPGPAVVNLEVFDVRGHRVSMVTREEIGAGNHVASWGGLSDAGTPLASGVYFARLRVQGPGINEELTRKITLTR